MGHRANYVFIENGEAHIYFSRWGAVTIPAVVLSGPEVTIAYVRKLTPDTVLLNDTWAEGGMLLDLDVKRMRFFGGFKIERKPYLRRPFLAAVRTVWLGWQVDWMTYGVEELARAVARDISVVVDAQYDDKNLLDGDMPTIRQEQVRVTAQPSRAKSLVTVRTGENAVADYPLTIGLYEALSFGPRLLDVFARRSPGALPQEADEPQVAYVDQMSRTVWIGATHEHDSRLLDAIARRWMGWKVQGHTEGLAYHVLLSGRDPAAVAVPDEQAVEELIAELTYEQSIDPMALYKHLTSSGDTVTVGVGFFSKDDPPSTPKEREALLRRLFADSLSYSSSEE